MEQLKQKALALAEIFDEQADFGFEMVLQADGTTDVSRQVQHYQIKFAKEHQDNAQLLRELVDAINWLEQNQAMQNLVDFQQELEKGEKK
jgi:hypothetical protein